MTNPFDEGELRRRYPEIPWDQPVRIKVLAGSPGWWVCRVCIALHGLKASELETGGLPFAFMTRRLALDHIEMAHHE